MNTVDWSASISSVVQDLKPSGIRQFFDIVATRKDCISLGVGEPDFVTPQVVIDHSIQALRDGYTHYTGNAGLLSLRREIARYLEKEYGLSYNAEKEILITVGVSQGVEVRDGHVEESERSEGDDVGLRVLVAEDNLINQEVTVGMLADLGCTAMCVGDGEQALAALAGEAFDLVLMDCQMPVMDGFEATRRIVALAPGLPVVGQTAHALPEERARCLACGMAAHVAKPIELTQLVTALMDVTRRDRRP